MKILVQCTAIKAEILLIGRKYERYILILFQRHVPTFVTSKFGQKLDTHTHKENSTASEYTR